MTSEVKGWLIVQSETGHCEIFPTDQVIRQEREQAKTWGPYESQAEAIAKRVGLIRAGQCKPV
jgi:hypothetical protein